MLIKFAGKSNQQEVGARNTADPNRQAAGIGLPPAGDQNLDQ
jgi:hypothetical protein